MTNVVQTVPGAALPLGAIRALGDAAAGIPFAAFAGADVPGTTTTLEAAVSGPPKVAVTEPGVSNSREEVDPHVDNMGGSRYGGG